jgi:tetratricopeptide (TPR) repeat protein
MPDAATRPLTLSHAVFLERATQHPTTSPEVRLGQGAFLVLRLLDLLATDHEVPVTRDAFQYQWAATDRYCRELGVGFPEAAHLQGLVRTAGDAHGRPDVRLLAPALLAYAHFLEDEGHYDEAADIVLTTLHVGGARMTSADRIAAELRLGRVRRKVMRWEEAEAAYGEAGRLAGEAGDSFSVLLSRLGRVNVLHFRGNLAEAERQYWGILEDARAGGHQEAEARGEHGLGSVLTARGQAAEAVPHFWRCFELYQDQSSKLRALQDLGFALLTLGEVASAETALLQVVQCGAAPDSHNNALIELMHCASFRRDRVGFERWREKCEEKLDVMAPNMRADFLLKAGIGLARFGQFPKAGRLMEQALGIASEHRLHRLEFQIERIKNGLRDCEAEVKSGQAVTEPLWSSEEVRAVSVALAQLAISVPA